MGQSLLIDMNSGWFKHKTEFNEGLRTQSYDQVKGALNALNALLPQDYRVTIDTEEYDEMIRNNLVALCNYCDSEYEDPEKKDKMVKGPTRIDVSKMKKIRLLLPSFEQMLSGRQYDEFWQCEKCNKDNRLADTKFKQSVLRRPFYLQVVPDAPVLRPGIEDRINYHTKFERWARNFLAELNAQARQFRHDYKSKDEVDDMEGSDGFGMDEDSS